MPEIRLDLIYQEENAAAIDRAIARIRALSAAADENVRRMGAYAGGIFNVRAMTEAEGALGRAMGAYQRLGSEIERTAAVGRLVPETFRAASEAASGFEAHLTRTAQTYRGLLDQFGRRITVGTAADVGGMAPGFAERVAVGAAAARAENVAQQRAYKAAAAVQAALQQRDVERDTEQAAIRLVQQRRDVERDAEQARERAAAQAKARAHEEMAFNAQVQAMGGRTVTPIRFERSMLGDLRAVRAEVEATGHSASQLGYFFNRAAVEMGEMARHARGQQISSLFATIRRVGSVGAVPLIGAIGGVMAGAELIHVANAMGKLAQETQNAAAATGMSVGQFSLLQRQMQLMGGSAETAVRLFGFLGTAVDQALADPMSKARGAFDELGISMDQLRDATQHPLALLDALRQRFQSMDEAQRKLVFGRNFEALIPYLRMTQEEFDRTKQAALDSGAVIGEDTAAQLAKTREATSHLS